MTQRSGIQFELSYLKLQSLVYGFSPLNFLVPPLLFPQNARKAISVFSAAAAAI